MKIAIDTFGCQHGKSGAGSYIFNFVANLPKDSDINFELFGSEIDRYTFSGDFDIPFSSIAMPDDLELEKIFHLVKINKLIRKQKYNVVLYPAVENVFPKSFRHNGVPVINTVLSTVLAKAEVSFKKTMIKTLSKSKLIIASSEYIKKDLINLGIEAKKINVIYNGIDHKVFYPSLDIDEESVEVQPFSIKRPYFIYSSRISNPDKKHIELIKAFEMFKKQTGSEHRLILAGDDTDYSPEVHKVAFESSVASDIFFIGYFPMNSLSKLYSGADACIFPAVNEGVGLPVLESMACGIPVICSNSGALKEFGGDIPLYFDSDNLEEMAEAMTKIIHDKDCRDRMVEKGLKRAAKFSWEETINKTLEIIKKNF